MKPGQGASLLKKLRPFSPLKAECSEDMHIEHAIAKALGDLWLCDGHHPARIAGYALEDANHHQAAAICFALAEGGLTIEKLKEIAQIRDTIVVEG